ncbi:ATP-dependent 6-phosphofructokinase 5, chloroplastic isoform X2 [Phoenix dactylifera]|uniref:ATP-dependent 6-phosphofructokinase 5, chloroplastic isoform X2 n=1 Tax=Phoenix dactylifera TaxID=42345 RepID=A0A8B8J7A7_PHODC|nr:ATP-dependent 6-phosphofructokinase 5, chloroplastic isoform X2 [Phoenix dactylifera]
MASIIAPSPPVLTSPSRKPCSWPPIPGKGRLRFKGSRRNRRRDRPVFAASTTEVGTQELDFGDTDWKKKYQDFERRFNIPHLTDLFPDLSPMPSTFSLKSRRSVSDDLLNGYPLDGQWNGYVNNNDRVLLKVINYSTPTSAGAECIDPDCTWVEQWVHRAGPREKIYFKPEEVNAAIITCGGLCPGLNDVIRQIVITLEIYGVKNIVGVPFGYRGFVKGVPEISLSRRVVQNIHLGGGSILGVARGGPSVKEIVDRMQERNINMLFVLGGNGTHAGANAIHKEAHSAYHGIGIVKLMGRSSGFIAMHASLASGQVDICLIPEVPFNLHGPNGVLSHLKYLIETKRSAVVCVAEGAGQNLLQKTHARNANGNIILGDIGVHIQQETKKFFQEISVPADVKYIDPTYMIRAVRANASDGILCTVLGQNAVHGAFAGFSGITVGICNTHYVYFPIAEVISYPKQVDPNSRMWHRCLTSTGQPDFI